ncbi:unnamed protein product [Ectocarpus sp. CCAP 1310/34]|nr:unnamed protein product [Ectocarpus sp. CCAP 1310/34]
MDALEGAASGFPEGVAEAGVAAGDALGELAAKETYGSLPSWNIVVICTVGGVLFFELICHQMNHAAEGKRHAQDLLETLYRELAILGVVAFILWSINVSPAVDIEYGDKHFFEQIHMALFLAALLHTFFVGVVALYARQINRRWDIFEDDEMRRYKDLKQQHRRTAQKLGIRHADLKYGIGTWRAAWLTVRHPILSRRLSELSEHVGYHAIRAQFIKSNQLPKNFRFASYLTKCEQSVVLELAGVKEGVWVALILFVGAELFVKGILGKAESSEDVKPIFITGTIIVMLAAIAVHLKLRSIYYDMIRSYHTERRDDLMQFVGPSTSNTMRQKSLFWFSRPGLMLVTLQSMQFLLAIMVGALIWFGSTDSTGVMILAEVFLGVGAFGIYTIVLPKFIPKYTTVTHVGAMVNRHILSECLVKQKRAFQHRALPPTLRQVSVMARMKANYKGENGRVMAFLRKHMSGHAWREFMQVLVTVHFFVVAYNNDPVRSGVDTTQTLLVEVTLGSVAFLLEIVTHFVVWKGKLWFRCSLFAAGKGEEHPPPGGVSEASAPGYPSGGSHRGLLEHASNSGGGTAEMPGAPNHGVGDGAQKLLSPHTQEGTMYPSGNYNYNDNEYYYEEEEDTECSRCSIWACFGWNGEDQGKRFFSVPPSARRGWWRTVDLMLVLVVAGESIVSMATYLAEGDYRVVHALQGLVILRWFPLMFCPFPPAEGHDDLHDVGGATVHHDPLSHNAREETLKETLALLRGQTKLTAVLNGNNMGHADGGNPAAGDDTDKLQQQQQGSAAMTRTTAASAEEEKGGGGLIYPDSGSSGLAAGGMRGGGGGGGGGGPDGIANVGVAVALREACAAHPDLVRSHGPLSAPILRAMVGLDPHKMTRRDDGAQALDMAARAVAVARGAPRSNAPGLRSSMEGGSAFHSHGGVGLEASHVGPSMPGGCGLGRGAIAVPPAFEHEAGGYPIKFSGSSSHSKGSAGGRVSSSSRHHHRRPRSRSRSATAAAGGENPVVPPAIEDVERPVLRSFATFASGGGGDGSQHGQRSADVAATAGGFPVPTGSADSVPHSSSRRGAARHGMPGGTHHRRRSHGHHGTDAAAAATAAFAENETSGRVVGGPQVAQAATLVVPDPGVGGVPGSSEAVPPAAAESSGSGRGKGSSAPAHLENTAADAGGRRGIRSE